MANKQLDVLIKQRQDAYDAEKTANAGKKNFKPKVRPLRPEDIEARRKTLEAELVAVAKSNIDKLVCDMNSMKFIRYDEKGNMELDSVTFESRVCDLLLFLRPLDINPLPSLLMR